jgi:putative PIN family toxin of toxin-antitoxin system
MRRVVLDTSVIASAFRSRTGASFILVTAVRTGRITALATPSLFLEYEDVLKRPEQRSVTGLTLSDVDQVLSALALLLEPVDVRLTWRPQLRDPNDELVLEAAINGRAEALITHNLRDFREAGPRFGLRILRPRELLRELAP